MKRTAKFPSLMESFDIYGYSERIAWSKDGRRIACSTDEHTVNIINAMSGEGFRIDISENPTSISWSPHGDYIAVGQPDGTVVVLNVDESEDYIDFDETSNWFSSPEQKINDIAFADINTLIAVACADRDVYIWDFLNETHIRLTGHSQSVNCVAWSPNYRMLLSGGDDGQIRVWSRKGDTIALLAQRNKAVHSLAWAPDGKSFASGWDDNSVIVWDVEQFRQRIILEEHKLKVDSLSYICGGEFLISKSSDGAISAWSTSNWRLVWSLSDFDAISNIVSREDKIAVFCRSHISSDEKLFVWRFDASQLQAITPVTHYRNAKIVLVGNNSVGKSGLGLVLSGDAWRETSSTHGKYIRSLGESIVKINDTTEEVREVLLWDLAGQPGYRLVHQLHLDEVAVAIIVFDASHELNPFSGIRYWDRALRQAMRVQGGAAFPMRKIVAAARTDVGGIGASSARIDAIKSEIGAEEYYSTSAKEGWGIAALRKSMIDMIDWDNLPKVLSTSLFQDIKDFISEISATDCILIPLSELCSLYLHSRGRTLTRELRMQFEACIGRVESRGLIRRLSFGNFVLLQPEFLDAYASWIVNAAKEEPDGLGCILEDSVAGARFPMAKDLRLPSADQERLLILATVEDMLRREIAMREFSTDGPILIFPTESTKDSFELNDPIGRFVSYIYIGPVANIYATLTVRLSYSNIFELDSNFRNGAIFKTPRGGVFGYSYKEIEEGKAELALFARDGASEELIQIFEDYIITHLKRRSISENIVRIEAICCSECNTPISDMQIKKRRERGATWIQCNVCDKRVDISATSERNIARSREVSDMDHAADVRVDVEANITSIAAEMATRDFMDWVGSKVATLSVVFTDIVGFTDLCNSIGNEKTEALLSSHYASADMFVAKHNGFSIKKIGDAVMAAFRSSSDALDFVVSINADPGANIKLRAGIHVGTVHVVGQDVVGAMVNYTSRVVGQADGAQVAVSNRVMNEIDEEKCNKHSRIKWTEIECELKGFGDETIFIGDLN